MKKILITGGSGLLGKELVKINSDIIAPSHSELDVTNIDNLLHDLGHWYRPSTIIHCAALLDRKIFTRHPEKAIETNIIGSANLAIACIKYNIRLVYLSTDYIYPGTKGNYRETDPILPFNFYAWTKLGGEAAIRGVKNHLIIRTSFGPAKFPYTHAFDNVWRSKEYVHNIAPDIYEAANSSLIGIVNIGGIRRTVYEYAKEENPNILPIKEQHSEFYVPTDTSLNLTKWKNYKNGII